MTVRAPIGQLREGERVLDEGTSRYLVRVLRLKSGAAFVGFDPDARTEAQIAILDANPEGVRVLVSTVSPADIVAERALTLVYSLAKGDKVDDVVRDATELGATHVIITRTVRSVVKIDAERSRTKLTRWKKITKEAARQSGRSDPPEVLGVLDWEEALETASSLASAAFCLDPHAPQTLHEPLATALDRGATIAFAIGPEGGLAPEEIEIAAEKGFLPVSIGPFVLRTETVAAAVLGAVRVLSDS